MLKKVLWLALACAVLLAVLYFSRGVELGGKGERPKEAPAAAVDEPARPAAKAPAEVVIETVPPPTPEELQLQDDASAVGMTTEEPEPAPVPDEAPEAPPTN